MRTILRHLVAALVLVFMPAPLAFAQGGPPPEVRAAVDATVAMLGSEGDAAIAVYIRERMTAAPSEDVARTSELRRIRSAVQGRTGSGVGVERAPDGVILEVSGPQGQARLNLGLADEGLVTRVELVDGGDGAGGSADASVHLRAIEDLPTMSLDTAVAAFEREHLSASYMARTSAAERRAVIECARTAAANAGAATIQRENDVFILNLRGGVNTDITVTVEAAPPYKIETLEVHDIEASAAPALTEANLVQTFETLAARGFSGTVHVERGGERCCIAPTAWQTPNLTRQFRWTPCLASAQPPSTLRSHRSCCSNSAALSIEAIAFRAIFRMCRATSARSPLRSL